MERRGDLTCVVGGEYHVLPDLPPQADGQHHGAASEAAATGGERTNCLSAKPEITGSRPESPLLEGRSPTNPKSNNRLSNSNSILVANSHLRSPVVKSTAPKSNPPNGNPSSTGIPGSNPTNFSTLRSPTSSPKATVLPPSPQWSWRELRRKRHYLTEEAWDQLDLGLPIAGTYLLDFLMQTVSLSFVGHLGTLQLAAAAMASSLINVTGFSFLEGLASAMETICGQAYGAEDYLALGDVAQRVHMILTAFCVPVALLLLNADVILVAVGQDPEVSVLATKYIQWELPGLFIFAAFLPLSKFLEVQGATLPLAAISLISFIFHVAINPVCIYVLNLGFLGAPIAYSITNLVQVLMAFGYLVFMDKEGLLQRCWRGWSFAQAFQGWAPYLTLAVPSCAMICLEWWFFEMLILFSGWLPNPQVNLAAMSVSLQIEGVLFMLPLAMSIAASVRVSNELGAGDARAAKYAALVSVGLAVVYGSLLAVAVWLLRAWLPLVFVSPSQVDVWEGISDLVPWLVGCETALCVTSVLSGVVRGSGQQGRGSLVNFAAFYVFGCPAAYLFAFSPAFNFGVEGLWGGLVVSLVVQTCTLAVFTANTNWTLQVDRAEATIEANKVDSCQDLESLGLLDPLQLPSDNLQSS